MWSHSCKSPAVWVCVLVKVFWKSPNPTANEDMKMCNVSTFLAHGVENHLVNIHKINNRKIPTLSTDCSKHTPSPYCYNVVKYWSSFRILSSVQSHRLLLMTWQTPTLGFWKQERQLRTGSTGGCLRSIAQRTGSGACSYWIGDSISNPIWACRSPV